MFKLVLLIAGLPFFHPERETETLVHGDDFAAGRPEEDLDWITAELLKKIKTKDRRALRPDDYDRKEAVCVDRPIWRRVLDSGEDCVEYEADQRHEEIALKQPESSGGRTKNPRQRQARRTQRWRPIRAW